MRKKKYYDLQPILKHDAVYNVIFGERSNGKTYGVLKHALQRWKKEGSQIAYIRRWDDDIRNKEMNTLFQPLIMDGTFKKITGYEHVIYYAGKFYIAEMNHDTGKLKKTDIVLGYAFAINMAEHYKSSSYPECNTLIFDEFITRKFYLNNEFVELMNLISTIRRDRDNVVIFMLGNTVNKYNPYFTEMGLNHAKDMKQGTIDVYNYGESGLTVAVEYCEDGTKSRKVKKDKYYAFNNPRLSMITTGAWEIELYPHITQKYRPIDILLKFIIEFDNEKLLCNVVNVKDDLFITVHRKTTDIKVTDDIIVYSQQYSTDYRYKRNILRPDNKATKIVYNLFTQYKVFYQDNEVGEVVANYLKWCREN